MSDLGLVATDDMLKELEARFDYLIFAAVKEMGPATGEHQEVHRWKGHVTFCGGMATDLIRDMQDWAREDEDDEEADQEA